MTERLYYTDSHLLEFDARVVSVSKLEDERALVALDRTAFYPTGGGQPNDTGTLGSARVVDCLEDDGAKVLHVVEGDAPEVGSTLRGRVDAATTRSSTRASTYSRRLSSSCTARRRAASE